MADSQATNVIEAGNLIKGLMSGTAETTETEPTAETAESEAVETEEAEDETSSEETVNLSDVPYKTFDEANEEDHEGEDRPFPEGFHAEVRIEGQ